MISRLNQILTTFLAIIASVFSYETYVAIEQCPGTEVPMIRQQAQNHEVSLIFYYTRWSTDSLAALEVYNDVAQYYSDNVYFSTIDCWHLSCNCSRALSTAVGSGLPHKWPTLVAHYGRRGQVQILYHGLWSFRDIQQFINNLLYPLERIYRKEDLHKIRKVSDAVIVGLFESPDSMEYKQYLIASLKWLESDPMRTYRCTVAFNASAAKNANVTKDWKFPNLILVGPTETRTFANSRKQNWNVSNIFMWLHKELKKDINQLHGYETPISVAQKVPQQPVFTIFVNDMRRFFAYMEPYVDPEAAYSSLSSKCGKMLKDSKEEFKIRWDIRSKMKDIRIYSDHSQCHYNVSGLFRHFANYYDINRNIRRMLPELSYPFKKSKHQNVSHMERILSFHHTIKCINSDITSSSFLQLGIAKYLQTLVQDDAKLLGSNRTMAVVLLETERYIDYLDNLNIEVQTKSMATSFIIDKEQEGIFLMDDIFSIGNVKSFTRRFHNKNVMPYFKSEKIKQPGFSKPNKLSTDFDLKQLNRHMFLNHLNYGNNQTLIVLIHSDECALCGCLQQTFIQLASALRHISSDMQFVRINAFHNNLPWQYNMPTLPALLVFPKHHYGETRLFPSHLKPDIRSVFGFILNQLSSLDQIKVAVAYCQSPSLSPKHTQSCWQFTKTLLTQHIGKHLHYWQLFEDERSVIFENLRAFKDISLSIQRNLRL